MRKPFLLIVGDYYYPESGTGDWIGCYATEKEALEQVEFKEIHDYYSKGKNKGEIKSTHTTYVAKGGEYDRNCDWYDVIDLMDWAER
jgi:hypothetical protein